MLMEVSGKKEGEGMQFDFFKKEHKLDYLVIRRTGALQWKLGAKEQSLYKDFQKQK